MVIKVTIQYSNRAKVNYECEGRMFSPDNLMFLMENISKMDGTPVNYKFIFIPTVNIWQVFVEDNLQRTVIQ